MTVTVRMIQRMGLFAFNQLSEEFSYTLFGFVKGAAPRIRNAIDAADVLSRSFLTGAQVATPFEAMKNRIQSSRADVVSVPGQLPGHSSPKNRLFACMMQNMQANHSGIEVAIVTHIDSRYRTTIS